jgi:uncharacterized membrane protein
MEKYFKDSDGKIVIWQKPNIPIIIWVVSLLLVQLTQGKLGEFFSFISYGALFTWAYLEIFHGVNLFRRLLGLIALVVTLYGHLY